MLDTIKVNTAIHNYKVALLAIDQYDNIKALLLDFYNSTVKPLLDEYNLQLVYSNNIRHTVAYPDTWWLDQLDKYGASETIILMDFVTDDIAYELYAILNTYIDGKHLVYYLPDVLFI